MPKQRNVSSTPSWQSIQDTSFFSSSITMSNNKVKIIQDQPELKKVKDIQSFLCFANFYCWFIFNYLDIVISLTCLIQKNIPWKFDFSYHNAFNSLKKALCSNSIYWISNVQHIVETNVSNCTLTAILFIVNEENKVHPAIFHICTFTIAKLNYDTYNKELLTIFEAFKIWQHYSKGLAFSIDVFIKNLEYFSTTKILT